MKRIYHPYKVWEDYLHGMWRKVTASEEVEMLKTAIDFTGDHVKYGVAMLRVIDEWPTTCEHNLTDQSLNKRAFIGHCAITLQLGIPEYITRKAWGQLTNEQQQLANDQADNAISEWTQRHVYRAISKHGKAGGILPGYQMKLQLN